MTETAEVEPQALPGHRGRGLAAVAGLGVLAPKARSGPSGNGVGERLVPPGKLGIQQFSIRDSITRCSIANSRANGLTPTMGYLGRPELSGGSDRPRPAGAVAGRLPGDVRVPRRARLPGVRVLPVHTERRTSSAASPRTRRSARIWMPPGSPPRGPTPAASAVMYDPVRPAVSPRTANSRSRSPRRSATR